MLKWIHKHGAAAETLVRGGYSPWSEAAQTALLACYVVHNTPALLTSAYLAGITDTTIDLLGNLSSIVRIEIDQQGRPAHLNLYPLRELLHLTSLRLDAGNFNGLGMLKYLTSLDTGSCQVDFSGPCAFTTSLVDLVVHSSEFMIFHAKGLSACSHLQHLQCHNATIWTAGNNRAEAAIFAGARFVVPHSISGLTALTSLEISNGHCGKCAQV